MNEPVTEEAARNELAAVRLFLKIPDDQSVMGFLRAERDTKVAPTFKEATAFVAPREQELFVTHYGKAGRVYHR